MQASNTTVSDNRSMRNKRNLDIIPVEGDILKIHISISFACVLCIVYNVKKTLVTRSTPWSAAFLQTPSYSVRAASNWIMRVGRENTLFSYFDVELKDSSVLDDLSLTWTTNSREDLFTVELQIVWRKSWRPRRSSVWKIIWKWKWMVKVYISSKLWKWKLWVN